MSRQGGGAGRSPYGQPRDAAYPNGDAYQRDFYLEADAYPVDPGYQDYERGRERERPRPADMPPGPPRPPRAERGGMPPGPGYGRRAGSQGSYDPGAYDRPWERPEEAMQGSRARSRPAGPRPRPAGPSPGQQRPAPPPRGPWPAGPYDSNGPGPYAPRQEPAAPAGPGAPGQGYPGRRGRGRHRGPGQGNPGSGYPNNQEAQAYQGQEFRRQAQGRPGPVPPDGLAHGWPPAEEQWPDQYGPAWAGTGRRPAPGQGRQHGRGQGQYGPGQPPAGPYGQGPYAAGPNGAGQYAAPPRDGQYGRQPPNPGAWQAAGPVQGQYGPRAAGNWQAAGPASGSGGWQAAGPEQGQAWAPGQGNGTAGSWQAAGPQQGPGWAPGRGYAGPGQFSQGVPGGAPWQANGAAPGQQPYPGQAQPGQSHGGQYQGAGGQGMRTAAGFSNIGAPVITQRDSALPDPQLAGRSPIAAIENDNIAAFARDLRALRSKAGLDYPDMAEKSHYTMRTLASAAGGLRLPTLPVLIAYVNACGGNLTEWEERWNKLARTGRQSTEVALPGNAPQFGQLPRGPNPANPGEIYVITSARERDARW